MTPDEKAAIEKRAASMGVSSGEYIRLAVDNFEKISPEQEAELEALAKEVNAVIPKMAAMLDSMSRTLQELHRENDAFFRERGIR
jgi:hypothetical protein